MTVQLRCADGKVVQPLPQVCIFCGQHASESKEQTFLGQQPGWGVLTSWLAALLAGLYIFPGTPRVAIMVPICKKHSRVIGRANALLYLALACALIALLFANLGEQSAPGNPGTVLFFGLIGVALVLVVVGGYIKSPITKTVQVERIGATEITLGGISSEFREAVMQAEEQQTAVSEPS